MVIFTTLILTIGMDYVNKLYATNVIDGSRVFFSYIRPTNKMSLFPVAHPKIAMHDTFFVLLILSIEKQQCAICLSIEQEDTHTHKQVHS